MAQVASPLWFWTSTICAQLLQTIELQWYSFVCLKGKRNAAFFKPYPYLKTSLAAQVNKAFGKNKLLGASARKQNFFSFPHFFPSSFSICFHFHSCIFNFMHLYTQATISHCSSPQPILIRWTCSLALCGHALKVSSKQKKQSQTPFPLIPFFTQYHFYLQWTELPCAHSASAFSLYALVP